MRTLLFGLGALAAVAASASAQDHSAALAAIAGDWNAAHAARAFRVEGSVGTFCIGAKCTTGALRVERVIGNAVFLTLSPENGRGLNLAVHRDGPRSAQIATGDDTPYTFTRR